MSKFKLSKTKVSYMLEIGDDNLLAIHAYEKETMWNDQLKSCYDPLYTRLERETNALTPDYDLMFKHSAIFFDLEIEDDTEEERCKIYNMVKSFINEAKTNLKRNNIQWQN